MVPAVRAPEARGGAFHHEALFYSDDDEFLAGTVPFIQDAIDAGEPALIVLAEDKIRRLQAELGEGPGEGLVSFADMAEVGQNPARIIPVWHEFAEDHAGSGRRIRGVGEPVWPGRSDAELVECEHHESLLNLALVDAPALWLMCPYDESALEDDVLAHARQTHPYLVEEGTRQRSGSYVAPTDAGSPFTGPLPEPPADHGHLTFSAARLKALRDFVTEHAKTAGMEESRVIDLVLSVNELATNSIRHAGGGGVLRVWRDDETLLCEVWDAGRIVEPLVGRSRPMPDQLGGRGIWVANALCDLVQVRSSLTGTVVRVHMRVR